MRVAAQGRSEIIGAAVPNYIRQGLALRRFVLTIEVATPSATEPFDPAIRGVLALARQIRNDPRIDALALRLSDLRVRMSGRRDRRGSLRTTR